MFDKMAWCHSFTLDEAYNILFLWKFGKSIKDFLFILEIMTNC